MPLSPIRVLSGLAALAAWCGGWCAAVVLTGSLPVALVAGLAFTVPLTSLWEWITHGVLYHRALPGLSEVRRIHVGGHHLSLFPPQRYVQSGPFAFMRFRAPRTPWQMSDSLLDSALTSGSQMGLHFVIGVPFILAPAWLATHSAPFLASATVSLLVISWLLAYVHGVIHTPRNRWVERQAWFCWLDRHHYIHHVDMDANINFLLPVCDFLFGTRKAALTPEEAARVPPFDEAKPTAWDGHRAAAK